LDIKEERKPAPNRTVYASPLERLGFRSARSLRSHASLHHILPARKPAVCFKVPSKRRKQPERYVKLQFEFVDKKN
jgi:hypothetical protein